MLVHMSMQRAHSCALCLANALCAEQAGVGRQPSHGAARQLDLWEQQGMLAHMQPSRLTVYRLLAGGADEATPALDLDWQRSLGLRLWCAILSTLWPC